MNLSKSVGDNPPCPSPGGKKKEKKKKEKKKKKKKSLVLSGAGCWLGATE